jgi:hypothetical protein
MGKGNPVDEGLELFARALDRWLPWFGDGAAMKFGEKMEEL